MEVMLTAPPKASLMSPTVAFADALVETLAVEFLVTLAVTFLVLLLVTFTATRALVDLLAVILTKEETFVWTVVFLVILDLVVALAVTFFLTWAF